MTFGPTSVEVTCVTLTKYHCIWIRQSMWIQWPFFPKTWTVEVTCVTLPKDHFVQVPWKYIKVCGYSDPFSKTWTKGHWFLDDLWPQVCWSHMCDSTQGSLCPSPMEIHQCMWIQWSILHIFNQDFHILRTYYKLRTYRMSDHIVSSWTKFRWDKNSVFFVTLFFWEGGKSQGG